MDTFKIQVQGLIKKRITLLFLLAFLIINLIVFRNYFFRGQIPLPANLLVSFYEPWKSYPVPEYPNGPPNKPIGFDDLRIFYPLRKITIEQIKNGIMPLWNPYVFSGNTLLATYQSAIFHPLSFLFLAMPQVEAWSWIIIIGPILGYYFTYLYLRAIRLNPGTSFFGATIFTLSGFSIVWLEESFMSYYSSIFLPLTLFSLERIFKKIEWWSFILLTVSLSFSILSGWFQMSLYVYGFSIAYAIFLLFKTKNFKIFSAVFLSFGLSLLISAIHLFPSIEALKFSPRTTTDAAFLFKEYLLTFTDLIRIIAPDITGNPATYNYFGTGFYHEKILFVGIPALIFFFYELCSLKTSPLGLFYKVLFTIALILTLSLPISMFVLYELDLPLVSKIIPSRMVFLVTFTLSILAAFGFEKFSTKPDIRKTAISLALIFASFLGVYYLIKTPNLLLNIPSDYISISLRSIYLQTAILLGTSLCLILGFFKRIRLLMLCAIMLLSISGSLYFANKYLYFSERSYLFPENELIRQLGKTGTERVLSVGDAYIERNILAAFNIFSPEGYDSIYIGRYGEFINSISSEGKYSSNIPRADAKIFIDHLKRVNDDIYYQRAIQLLGVKYFVVPSKEIKEDIPGFKKIWEDNRSALLSYNSAFPRFFLTNKYIIEKEPQKILDKIYDSATNLREILILEEKIDKKLDHREINGIATLVSYNPNRVDISTKTDGSSLLFLSDNYFPGWKAYIDGRETKIYRANYSFRAVYVPGGKSLISFVYQPDSFKWGTYLTLSGIVIAITCAIRIQKQNKI